MNDTKESVTEIVIAKEILSKKIELYLKNNICQKCLQVPSQIITYPNGNKYCIHIVEKANKKFGPIYSEIMGLINNKIKSKEKNQDFFEELKA